MDGTDAAHKLALLAANAFGMPVRLDAVHVEGLRGLRQGDVAAAAQLGYAVRLLAIARRGAEGVELRVHPALVPARHALARLPAQPTACWCRAMPSAIRSTAARAPAASPRPRPCWPTGGLARLPAGAHARAGVPTLGVHGRAAAQPAPLPMAQVRTRHFLRLLPGTALNEAEALRLLARAGLSVQRRAWGPAPEGGAAPTLLLLTAPA